MRNVYLTASVRTPIGRFGGALASWTAADLGVAAATAAVIVMSEEVGEWESRYWWNAGKRANLAEYDRHRNWALAAG